MAEGGQLLGVNEVSSPPIGLQRVWVTPGLIASLALAFISKSASKPTALHGELRMRWRGRAKAQT
jgi:hypothetical protein